MRVNSGRFQQAPVLAETDEFVLFDRGIRGGWLSLKLMLRRRPKGNEKRSWWLAWNGERWAHGKDMDRLAHQYPEVLAWSEAQARPRFALGDETDAESKA